MAKRDLLDMVQEILSDIDSDEVESIDDTVEAEQIVSILKSTYYAMMNNRDWPHLRRSIQISSLGDTAKPTHMKIQDGVKELCFLKYNKQKVGTTRKDYGDITFLQPDHFLHKTNQEDSSSSNVLVVTDQGGIEVLVRTNRAPSYATSFDDEYVVFDSYDSEVDSTMQESKIQAVAYVIPSWSSADDFIPDLPENAFPLLVEEAKSKAALRLAQKPDEKAEQEAGRQNRWLARKARRINGGIQYPNYGR
jgi:hypothetical protein